MTTLAEFYALVSAEVRRGTSFDSSIPAKVQQAVDWMERLHTFQYMEQYDSLTIVTTGTNPRAIPIPTTPFKFKKMLGWRIIDSGVYSDISKVDFYDIDKIEEDTPSAYWQDGMDYFWLDNTPDIQYSSEMAWAGTSVLGTDTMAEPYVINNYEALVLNQTMILLGPSMRDPNVIELYKPNRDELMKSAIDSDVEARQSWQGDSSQYGWEFRQHINKDG